MKRPKMIYVKWLDHYSHCDRWSKADYSMSADGLTCETTGFLMAETKKCLHVALSCCEKSDHYQTSDSIAILKVAIVKRKYLKL